MSDNKPSAEIIAKWKSRVKDPNTDEKSKETFKNLLKKWGEDVEDVVKKVGEEVVGKKERKPRTTKPKATKTSSADDVEKAKAEIKKKTGKTEEECETIIEQYRALRTKAQERKAKDVKASDENKKRVEKLEKKGDIIEGTNEKTADAVIETAKVDVVEKIEKEIEKAEVKAEVEAKREVEKEMPKESATEKKKAVAEKVEKKVKEKTKVVVKRVIVDTTAMIESIATKLAQFDKESQKEFLIKLRSDIDKLLTKFAFGGEVQSYNITQSNMSSSSVNMFAGGGGVDGKIKLYDVIAYKNAFDYDDKKNAFVVADSYIRKVDAEDTLMKWKKTYPYIEIKEYMGKDPYKKYAGGGLIEMFSDNDDSDYVNDELDDIMTSYDVDEETIEEIIRDRSISDVDDLKRFFEDAYFGYADSDNDLGEKYVEMLGSISELGTNTLETYFDYDAFGRDLAYDYVEYNGHYFNNSYKRGGGVRKVNGKKYPFGSAWALEHNKVNKSERYEIPMGKRKKMAQGGSTSFKGRGANIDMAMHKRRGM